VLEAESLSIVAFVPQAGFPATLPWGAFVECTREGVSRRGQRDLAAGKQAQAEERAVRWLLGLDADGAPEVQRNFRTRAVKLKKPAPERIAEYRDKLAELRAVEREEQPAFGRPVRKDWNQLKAEIRTLRTGLLRDLDAILKDPLKVVLTEKQQKLGPVPD